MTSSKTKKIFIVEDDLTTVEIDIDRRLIEFYKKETGHVRVSDRGLSRFFGNLVKLFKP